MKTIKSLALSALSLALLGAGSAAFASCKPLYQQPDHRNDTTVAINGPAYVIVPASAPVGTVLYTSPDYQLPAYAFGACDADDVGYNEFTFAPSAETVVKGMTPMTIETARGSGIGVRWYVDGKPMDSLFSENGDLVPGMHSDFTGPGKMTQQAMTLRFEIVKTGPQPANMRYPVGSVDITAGGIAVYGASLWNTPADVGPTLTTMKPIQVYWTNY